LRLIPTMGLLLAGCALAACGVTRQPRSDAAEPQTDESGVAGPTSGVAGPTSGVAGSWVIFVARRGWHIDIGFAAADLGAPLNSVAAQFPEVKYVFFGFGDRHYLLAKERGASTMLGALWPGPGMLLVTGLKATPAEAFGASQVIALSVSSAQARAAQAFILSSFANPSLAAYAPGPYEGSLYFSAVPRYSAFHTCNTWAAEALNAAGLPVRTTAVLFAGQLWSQVEKLARASLNRKEAGFHCCKPLSFRPAALPRSSSQALAGYCC
jgi:hypothetical protein